MLDGRYFKWTVKGLDDFDGEKTEKRRLRLMDNMGDKNHDQDY